MISNLILNIFSAIFLVCIFFSIFQVIINSKIKYEDYKKRTNEGYDIDD